MSSAQKAAVFRQTKAQNTEQLLEISRGPITSVTRQGDEQKENVESVMTVSTKGELVSYPYALITLNTVALKNHTIAQ